MSAINQNNLEIISFESSCEKGNMCLHKIIYEASKCCGQSPLAPCLSEAVPLLANHGQWRNHQHSWPVALLSRASSSVEVNCPEPKKLAAKAAQIIVSGREAGNWAEICGGVCCPLKISIKYQSRGTVPEIGSMRRRRCIIVETQPWRIIYSILSLYSRQSPWQQQQREREGKSAAGYLTEPAEAGRQSNREVMYEAAQSKSAAR